MINIFYFRNYIGTPTSFVKLDNLTNHIINSKVILMTKIQIDESWKIELNEEFNSLYMSNLRVFLKEQVISGKKIYPPMDKIFNAFNFTPLTKVKVVIVGQDPYHGEGQAEGLSFSVP